MDGVYWASFSLLGKHPVTSFWFKITIIGSASTSLVILVARYWFHVGYYLNNTFLVNSSELELSEWYVILV